MGSSCKNSTSNLSSGWPGAPSCSRDSIGSDSKTFEIIVPWERELFFASSCTNSAPSRCVSLESSQFRTSPSKGHCVSVFWSGFFTSPWNSFTEGPLSPLSVNSLSSQLFGSASGSFCCSRHVPVPSKFRGWSFAMVNTSPNLQIAANSFSSRYRKWNLISSSYTWKSKSCSFKSLNCFANATFHSSESSTTLVLWAERKTFSTALKFSWTLSFSACSAWSFASVISLTLETNLCLCSVTVCKIRWTAVSICKMVRLLRSFTLARTVSRSPSVCCREQIKFAASSMCIVLPGLTARQQFFLIVWTVNKFEFEIPYHINLSPRDAARINNAWLPHQNSWLVNIKIRFSNERKLLSGSFSNLTKVVVITFNHSFLFTFLYASNEHTKTVHDCIISRPRTQ